MEYNFDAFTIQEENEGTNGGSNTARLLAGRYLPMAATAILLFFAAKLIL